MVSVPNNPPEKSTEPGDPYNYGSSGSYDEDT